jgi:hypothetical protein
MSTLEELQKMDDEQIKKRIRKFKPVPTFEFLIVLVFMAYTVLLAFYPKLFEINNGRDYVVFDYISNELGWSVIFFFTGFLNGLAVIKNSKMFRRIGLIIAACIWMVFFLNFMNTFPNFSTLLYLSFFIACFVALFEVNRTEL